MRRFLLTPDYSERCLESAATTAEGGTEERGLFSDR